MNNNSTKITKIIHYTKAHTIRNMFNTQNILKLTSYYFISTWTATLARNSTVSDTLTIPNDSAYNNIDILGQWPWPDIITVWPEPWNHILSEWLLCFIGDHMHCLVLPCDNINAITVYVSALLVNISRFTDLVLTVHGSWLSVWVSNC